MTSNGVGCRVVANAVDPLAEGAVRTSFGPPQDRQGPGLSKALYRRFRCRSLAPRAQDAPMAGSSDAAHDPPHLGGVPTVDAAAARAVHEAVASPDGLVAAAAANVTALLSGSLVEDLCGKPVGEAVVTVMAGTGHKGSIALAVARSLAEADTTVIVVLSRQPKEYGGLAAEALGVLDKAAKKVYTGYNERAFDQADIVIDGLIGAGLEGKPKASVSLLVKGANFSIKPIVALDVPTGLDATTGVPAAMTVKARTTLAIGLPKRGLAGRDAHDYTGRVFLVDAGVDPELWKDVAGVVDAPAAPKGGWRELSG